MKSIRLSLIVYFLLLLGLALGAVMAVAYQTSQKTLLAKDGKLKEFVIDRHQANCNSERTKLDEMLLRRARNLSSFAHRGLPRYRGLLGALSAGLSPNGYVLMHAWLAENNASLFRSVHVFRENEAIPAAWGLGALSAGLAPNGYLLLPLWDAESAEYVESVDGRSARGPGWNSPGKILFAEEILSPSGEGHELEYVQVFSGAGVLWQRSRSFEETGASVSFDADEAAKLTPGRFRYDDVALASGQTLRRITYKSPLPFLLLPAPPRVSRRGGAGRGFWGVPDERAGFYIQCAVDTGRRDAAIAALDETLQEELATAETESSITQLSLRNRLIWISIIAFGATLIGGLLIVRLGLSPLQRLSEAVSRVSAKDLQLSFDEPHLPIELRPITDRLDETFDLLRRAFAREKHAAADISHELRTPLAALLTTIDLALRKPRKPEEYRELLEDCRASGQHMNQLVERLLTLARLDAGVDLVKPQQVDVTELAGQCADLVRPLAEAQHLSLSVHTDGPIRLTTDPHKLREVMTNLLHNAIQYNRPQGSVDLTVGRTNGHVAVEVRDTGIGIAPKARERIFERFYRVDPSREADGLHAGLGLAIVKGYVDLIGGTIAVESAEGKGSTFRLSLPVNGNG
jgi:heavy metal sensor kinase